VSTILLSLAAFVVVVVGTAHYNKVGLNLDDSPLPERSAAISPVRNDNLSYLVPPPAPPLSPASAAAATALDAVTAARFPSRSPTSGHKGDNQVNCNLGTSNDHAVSGGPGGQTFSEDDTNGKAAPLLRPPAPQRKVLPPPPPPSTLPSQPLPAPAPASATRRFPDKSSIGMLESELNDELLTV